jgi:hypothetical protein
LLPNDRRIDPRMPEGAGDAPALASVKVEPSVNVEEDTSVNATSSLESSIIEKVSSLFI